MKVEHEELTTRQTQLRESLLALFRADEIKRIRVSQGLSQACTDKHKALVAKACQACTNEQRALVAKACDPEYDKLLLW